MLFIKTVLNLLDGVPWLGSTQLPLEDSDFLKMQSNANNKLHLSNKLFITRGNSPINKEITI